MTQCAVVMVLAWVAALSGWSPTQGRSQQTAPRMRIVLVGDSTVTDESGWGLGFRRLVSGQAEVVNEAASGRSSKSYLAEGRWTRALALKGHYYLIQFGHNDQPGKGPERETDPETTFRQNIRRYVDEARGIGAHPVLVTSLTRRHYTYKGTITTTLTPYVDAVKAVAAEKRVPVIDLHAISITHAEQAGDAEWARLSPLDDKQQIDRTHLNEAGSVVVGGMVAAALRTAVPDLARYLRWFQPPAGPPSERSVLWYRAPAANWNEALPIGNGRLGAMVFGGVRDERIQLNEDSVWAGQKMNRTNPAAGKAIPEIRRLLAQGRVTEAEKLADTAVISQPRRMPPYQTLGDLILQIEHTGTPTDYRRELDVDQAVARVDYTLDGVRFTREVFATAIEQVIVVRLTADQPGRITLSATLRREADATARVQGPDTVILEGRALPPKTERQAAEPKAGVTFAGLVRVVADGGRVQAAGDRVSVERADAVDAAGRRGDQLPRAGSGRRLPQDGGRCGGTPARPGPCRARARLPALLPARRVPARRRRAAGVHPDRRAARARQGRHARRRHSSALYFQFGRYLLISSSRPGRCRPTCRASGTSRSRRRGTASTRSTSTPR